MRSWNAGLVIAAVALLVVVYFLLKAVRYHNYQRTAVPAGAQTLRLRMPGWTVVEQTERMTVWRDSDGDTLTLAQDRGTLGLPPLSNQDAVRRRCRAIAESKGSGLVEVAVVGGTHGRRAVFVYKRLELPAFVFTGVVVVPAASATWVWTVVARERGTTGVREAVVTAQLMNEGKLTPGSYEDSWARDPYDPAYRGVDRSTLRYLSDDESYDRQFPRHPLSKVRRELKRLATVSADHLAFERPTR